MMFGELQGTPKETDTAGTEAVAILGGWRSCYSKPWPCFRCRVIRNSFQDI